MNHETKVRKTEKAVLDNYTISSPSFIDLNSENFYNHLSKRHSLFQYKLNLPTKVFNNATLLDFGAGTGEQDICYAKWGAQVDLVEINPISVERIKKYFKSLNLEHNLNEIFEGSIFDFKTEKKYDIVVSEGVLHHTDDPYLGFKILVDKLKPNGFVMLQLGFDSSMLQRSLHRLILDILTKGDYSLILEYSPILFKNTLERASMHGGRSIEQIVHDFYTNPKHKAIGLIDVLDWFKESNITYYSSYPSIEIENLINGIHKNGGGELISKYPQLRAFSELYFMIASNDDEILFEDLNSEIHTVNKNFDELIKYHKLDDYVYGANINPCKEKFINYFAL